MVSGSADKTVRLWDAETGESLSVLTGHTGGVASVAFSPDGHRLASADRDGTLRLWSPDTGQPLGVPLVGHTRDVESVTFSPDGTRIASGSLDGTVWIWPAIATPEMICDKLTANMSHSQWREWVSPNIDYIKVCPDLPVAPD